MFIFFKQDTAYEMRISDWSSDVCSSDLLATLIVDPDGKGLDSHWQKTAFALLVGVILHALYKARNDGGTATLPSVDAMLADPNRDIGEQNGRRSCRKRECQDGKIEVIDVI